MYLGKLEHGKVIRRIRMERQLSIEDVAERINVDAKFIKELEDEMYPDISVGIFYKIAEVFEMEGYELFKEIGEANVDYFNRILTHRVSSNKVMIQRDKQRKRYLQKEMTHNFKSKHTKHPFKKKFAPTNKRPTVPTMKISYFYGEDDDDN